MTFEEEQAAIIAEIQANPYDPIADYRDGKYVRLTLKERNEKRSEWSANAILDADAAQKRVVEEQEPPLKARVIQLEAQLALIKSK